MSASPEQLHSVLSFCLDFARSMLEKHGEFHPFGAKVNRVGQVVAVGGFLGDEHRDSRQLFEFLLETMRAEVTAGDTIASAVAVDVNIPEHYSPVHNDGVRVTLEAEGHSQHVYVPYRLSRAGFFKKRKADFAEPFSVELNPQP